MTQQISVSSRISTITDLSYSEYAALRMSAAQSDLLFEHSGIIKIRSWEDSRRRGVVQTAADMPLRRTDTYFRLRAGYAFPNRIAIGDYRSNGHTIDEIMMLGQADLYRLVEASQERNSFISRFHISNVVSRGSLMADTHERVVLTLHKGIPFSLGSLFQFMMITALSVTAHGKTGNILIAGKMHGVWALVIAGLDLKKICEYEFPHPIILCSMDEVSRDIAVITIDEGGNHTLHLLNNRSDDGGFAPIDVESGAVSAQFDHGSLYVSTRKGELIAINPQDEYSSRQHITKRPNPDMYFVGFERTDGDAIFGAEQGSWARIYAPKPSWKRA